MRPDTGAQLAAAAGDTGIAEMFLALEDEALRTGVALRVQTEGAGRQPLSRVDVTDLALMIVTGGAMSRALAAAAAGQPPVSTLPGGYGQSW
jgi:fructose-specific phosphotransferase system component IIB